MKPSSLISGLTAYKVPKHPAPVDLLLDANEGPAPDASLLDALAGDAAELLGRYPSRDALEAELAARLGVSRDQVLATAGGDDALDRACRALLGPGRRVVLPEPSFEMLRRYAAWAGGEVVSVPWPDGPWPVDAVIQAVDDAVSLIAVVTPNNPTGCVARADDLRRLAATFPDVVLLVDLAYGEFADDDLLPTALGLPNALVFGTLSKAWGMAGARVGWVAGPAILVGWLRAAGNPYTVGGPSARLALARLRGHDIAPTVARVRAERQALTSRLRAHGFAAPDSQANFVFARDARAPWLRDALAGLGIAVRAWPGHPELGDAIRVTCPADPAAFERLSAAVDAALAPEALLFDMDGVLADVSSSYRAAIVRTAEGYGVRVSAADVRAAKARGDANNDWVLTRRLLADAGVEVPLTEVTRAFEAIYQGTHDVPGLKLTERCLVPPAQLRALSARFRIGVVTGRPRADAVEWLTRFGLADWPEALVCMEDAPPKPDPTPVRRCLEALGVRAAWMFGDTVDDARAARAAGVVPIGVAPPGEDPDEVGATLLAAGAARALPDTLAALDLLARHVARG